MIQLLVAIGYGDVTCFRTTGETIFFTARVRVRCRRLSTNDLWTDKSNYIQSEIKILSQDWSARSEREIKKYEIILYLNLLV